MNKANAIEQQYNTIATNGAYSKLNKTLLKLSAFNVEKTIKAISTNETTKPKNAFIDNFGRLVALVDQKIIDRDNCYLLMESSVYESFAKHCEKYFKLARIKTEVMQLQAFHVFSTTKLVGDLRFQQPFGYITLLAENELHLLQPLQEISVEFKELYDIFRLENNYTIQNIDFTSQMFLETNWDDLAVSYTKGCFLGQEILARVHNLGKPAKKLVRIMFDKEPAEFITRDGEKLGKITTQKYSFKYKKYLAFAIISGYEQKEVDNGIIQ